MWIAVILVAAALARAVHSAPVSETAAALLAVPTPTPLPGLLFPRESPSRTLIDLSGIWDFRAEGYPGQGTAEAWFERPLRSTGPVLPMPVPASYNDITANSSLRDFVGVVWYERPATFFGAALAAGRSVRLYFGSVHYAAAVYLNGQLVVTHEGGHLPFEADVTSILNYETANRITVAVNNTLFLNSLPPGSVSTNSVGRVIQNLQMDFFNYAGIHREVLVYTVPASVHVADITAVTQAPLPADGAVVVGVSVVAPGASTLTVTLLDATGAVAAQNSSSATAEGAANLLLNVPDANLWWPWGMSVSPAYLYTLQVTATDSSGTTDCYSLEYGIRTVGIANARFLVNGQPFYFTGAAGHHEDADVRGKALDYPMIVRTFNMLRWLGANSFRSSHYPYSETILDLAQRYGIVVIGGSPGVGIESQNQVNATLAHHYAVEAEQVRRDKNRANVFVWSVANEPDSACATASAYFGSVMAYVRALDSTRPVAFVSDHSASDDLAVPHSDMVFFNFYQGWYVETGELDTIGPGVMQHIQGWLTTYPDKPVMQTEFGADTLALADVNRFIFTEDFQAAFLAEHWAVFDSLRNGTAAWVGEHIWCLTDFMTSQSIDRVVGNRKGILSRNRQPKAAAYAVQERYQSLAQQSLRTPCPLSAAQLANNGCSAATSSGDAGRNAMPGSADLPVDAEVVPMQQTSADRFVFRRSSRKARRQGLRDQAATVA